VGQLGLKGRHLEQFQSKQPVAFSAFAGNIDNALLDVVHRNKL
jgi:hypothetical protein